MLLKILRFFFRREPKRSKRQFSIEDLLSSLSVLRLEDKYTLPLKCIRVRSDYSRVLYNDYWFVPAPYCEMEYDMQIGTFQGIPVIEDKDLDVLFKFEFKEKIYAEEHSTQYPTT